MMNEVEVYIQNCKDKNQKQLLQYFHSVIMSFEDITTKLSFKIPFYYYQKKWLCYINPIKPNGIEFCFNKGFELSNKHQILEAKERVLVKGISFFDTENEERIEQLIETIEEAKNNLHKSKKASKNSSH
jgi:hypothetical protein